MRSHESEERRRIGRVFEEHRGFVEAVAVQHAGRDDAADVVSEVGLRLVQSLNGLREPKAVRSWIYRLTVNVSRDMVRERFVLEHTKERISATTSPHERTVDPDETVRLGRRRDALRDAVARMKTRDRSLICNDLGLGRVHVGDGADRVARHRARLRLRQLLDRDPRMSE